jgi:hypothetical protein
LIYALTEKHRLLENQ